MDIYISLTCIINKNTLKFIINFFSDRNTDQNKPSVICKPTSSIFTINILFIITLCICIFSIGIFIGFFAIELCKYDKKKKKTIIIYFYFYF